MIDLKKCPFCECNLLNMREPFKPFEKWCVRCVNCDAEGPLADTEDEAQKLWNRREPGKE